MRESWWVPFWKPVWGHPRLAFGAALLAVLVVAFSFWPVDDAAFASPVNVQDVSADDPDRPGTISGPWCRVKNDVVLVRSA